MKLILPELLFARLIEEWEIANMVDEDVAQNWQFGVDWRNLTKFRSKGGAEALECGWGVEFGDFVADLTGDELALEVCRSILY